VRVLLDTHVFLWWVLEDPRLSPLARETITDPDVDVQPRVRLGDRDQGR